MKKALIAILLILSTVSICYADFVDKSKVSEIANRWFGCDDFTITISDDGTLYYVNADKGGWLILSAEDSTTPILGYNDSGSINIEKMPSHIRSFLGNYSKTIEEGRQYSLQANAKVKTMWRTAGFRTKTSTGKLLKTANWDQDEPYNLYCPTVTENGRKYTALTGCVATSTAIIMRYHRWPERGKGTIGGYTYTSDYNKKVNIPSYSIDDHVYDYDLMPLNYTSSATTAQKEAVSLLMHDLGVMFKANYNYQTGTGAYAEDIQDALYEYMGYSGNAYHLYRSACSSDAEFIRIIKAEIDADRPIPYGGSDPQNGGHQFLCDGYDSKDYVHINWGWSGDMNGYFAFDLNVPGQYSFYQDQSIIVGLEPDRESSTTSNGGPIVLASDSSLPGYKGITITNGSLESKSFSVKVGGLYNLDMNLAYNGKLRMVLSDYRGNVKEVISKEQSLVVDKSELKGISEIKCQISKEYALGDRVQAQYLAKGGTWSTINCFTDYASFTNGIAVIDTPFILTEDSYSAGDSFILELIPGNSYIKSYTWYFDGAKQSHISVSPLSSGVHTILAKVTLSNGTILNIKQQIMVN